MPTGNYERPKIKLNCNNCKEDFYITHVSQGKGLCKKCAKRESDRLYKEKNRKKLAEKQKAYIENNKESVKEYRAKYYAENKEDLQGYFKKYYRDNREHILAKSEESRRARGEKKRGLSGTEDVALMILREIFPDLEIRCNDRKTIRNPKTRAYLELDFYLPQVDLAIELNGITHYKPIYGEEKFKRQKRNDLIKRNLCRRKGITLIAVPLDDGVHFDRYDSEHEKLRKTIKSYIKQWRDDKDWIMCNFKSHIREI